MLADGTMQYVWGATGVAYSINKSTNAVTVYDQNGLGYAGTHRQQR